MKDELDYPDHAPTTRKIWGGAVFMVIGGPVALILIMVTVAYKEYVDKFGKEFVMFLYHNPVVAFIFYMMMIFIVVCLIIKSAKRG